MKNIIVLTIKLLIITVVAGIVLGVVNAVTADPIAAREKEAADAARYASFPSASGFAPNDIDIPEEYAIIQSVYTALDDTGNGLGVTVAMETKGFNAGLNLTVGLGADGTITGVVIGSHEETPGLGAKAAEPWFTNRYKDKRYAKNLVVVKTPPTQPNEIEAITSATITTVAVTDAVNTAAAFYEEMIGGAK